MNEMQNKTMLTLEEAVDYTGYSRSYFYKLTSTRKIPYYKPNGKRLFFNREELERWLQQNRIATEAELNEKAQKMQNRL